MFGSLKINGQKIVRELSLKEALPGFVIITANRFKDHTNAEVGDLLLKTQNGRIANISKQVIWRDDVDQSYMSVTYSDVDINFQKVIED